ncbi:MAG: hypothetical protein QOI74_2769 [Micromonosporaceae bacterium]|nr:hypothetical protein [Micromonosporaceae bacterium]
MTGGRQPSYAHLLRLSDDVGLLEHARGAVPRRAHGYCLDDVARGLVVVCREPDPTPELVGLAERYLAFVSHAQSPSGAFRNRLSYERRWLDEPDTGDWWGRAMWGLGTAAARGPTGWLRDEALTGFDQGAHCRSRWPRSMAFAALGAAEILDVLPGHPAARRLLADTATAIGPAGVDARWRWPEARLGYANAALAEALIAAGHHLGRQAATDKGLRLLGWLLEREVHDGHLSPTPVGGRGPGDTVPGFDQQPIEAAALADACARALLITAEPRWAAGLELAIAWFTGDNDARTEMFDPATGGGYDGLQATGRNANQGAESTLALVSTLQHRQRFASLVGATTGKVQD